MTNNIWKTKDVRPFEFCESRVILSEPLFETFGDAGSTWEQQTGTDFYQWNGKQDIKHSWCYLDDLVSTAKERGELAVINENLISNAKGMNETNQAILKKAKAIEDKNERLEKVFCISFEALRKISIAQGNAYVHGFGERDEPALEEVQEVARKAQSEIKKIMEGGYGQKLLRIFRSPIANQKWGGSR
ncbi:MAG: hypothetical protein LBU87_03365 [Lactobacillales bacterium]|jgi:hypothetical protein|nr:hypothetical protein [Lactobacillales bacterium]